MFGEMALGRQARSRAFFPQDERFFGDSRQQDRTAGGERVPATAAPG
ncbi:MAG: hypothetical protein Q8N33_05165 [Rhodocyclaceae bacterium]|nr:hypothetical protein [Rhodocyclaceae bacterium]